MNINDLPDLCFELIFDHISDLPTLDNLRRVCSRWRTLVQTRLQKITHLEYAPYMVLVKKITQKELTGKYIHTDQLRFLEMFKTKNITTRLPCPCAALANLLATGNPITELKFRLCDFTSGLPSIDTLKGISYLIIFHLLEAFYCVFVNAVGIGVGAHRLWSHRSFKAKTPLRVFLALAFTSAGQKSLGTWVRDHRTHHKFSETDADPHNAKRGFFFAHQGWLLVKRHPDNVRKSASIDMDDVLSDPVVIWSTKYYTLLLIITLILVPTLIPFYCYQISLFHCLLMTGVRYVISLHGTWLVNSAAHLWGDKPYDKTIYPSEAKWIAWLIPVGEFYHNYHHTFPQDYKASEFGWFGQWNTNAAFIDLMALIGQAYDLKTAPKNLIESRKARASKLPVYK
ncbi:stearoyl-CoA desaturase 5-like [Panonychus citri]|uniref:stearoyl-CoA desaturase 5-like n=1 Tax=Panonychus citri TaxID=50023 RepID=UPI002306EB69|nr:stearoyl-CoA desaturase 5-like [Panonychus citri]